MSLEYIANKGAQLVKRCDTRDPFKIAKDLGIKVMFVDEFEKGIALVCKHPELYPLSRMPEVAARGYRAMPVMRYIALYAIRDGKVIVAHIFHSLQDYARYV